MTITEQHPALGHRCPFCNADPGQACRTHRGRGTATALHSRRIALTRSVAERQPAARANALCCSCGSLRTVSNDYRRSQDPNEADSPQGRKEGWRRTQSLKCAVCGQSTRHALLMPADSRFGDWDEKCQRYILGGDWDGQYPPDLERLRDEYFAQFPRNPYLRHRYWTNDAQAAWGQGERVVTALCGEKITLEHDPSAPSSTRTTSSDDLLKPDEMRDQEYEDDETGMWWVDMQCVNCLAVSNGEKLKHQRRELLTQLLEVSAVANTLDAGEVASLREHLVQILAARCGQPRGGSSS